MILQNELRIGNKVKRNGIVVTADFMTAANCFQHPEQYEPIEISPEILEKAGFVDDMIAISKGIILLTENPNGEGYCLFVGSLSQYVKGLVIKYVHQLQNVYYALMNEELNIQL